jgi:hypothetical protein
VAGGDSGGEAGLGRRLLQVKRPVMEMCDDDLNYGLVGIDTLIPTWHPSRQLHIQIRLYLAGVVNVCIFLHQQSIRNINAP